MPYDGLYYSEKAIKFIKTEVKDNESFALSNDTLEKINQIFSLSGLGLSRLTVFFSRILIDKYQDRYDINLVWSDKGIEKIQFIWKDRQLK
jgi:hypothetical protein